MELGLAGLMALIVMLGCIVTEMIDSSTVACEVEQDEPARDMIISFCKHSVFQTIGKVFLRTSKWKNIFEIGKIRKSNRLSAMPILLALNAMWLE